MHRTHSVVTADCFTLSLDVRAAVMCVSLWLEQCGQYGATLPFGSSFCGDLVRVQGQGASRATGLWVCVCFQTALFLPLACQLYKPQLQRWGIMWVQWDSHYLEIHQCKSPTAIRNVILFCCQKSLWKLFFKFIVNSFVLLLYCKWENCWISIRNDLLASKPQRKQVDVCVYEQTCSANCSVQTNKGIDSVLLEILKKRT